MPISKRAIKLRCVSCGVISIRLPSVLNDYNCSKCGCQLTLFNDKRVDKKYEKAKQQLKEMEV